MRLFQTKTFAKISISCNVFLQWFLLFCFLCFFLVVLFAVPSQPPQSVQAFNTSSTSVRVLWHRVPKGLVHGILRGYRIFYGKTEEFGVPMRQVVVPAHTRYVHLAGLEKFTNYSIQVAAFTRIGVGAKSPELVVSTDEDGTWSSLWNKQSLIIKITIPFK